MPTVAIDGCDSTAIENYAAVTTAEELIALGVTINEECSSVEVFSEVTFDGNCPIVATRNYWVVDECGNVSNTISQTINIQDTTSPWFTTVIPEQYLVGQGGQFFIPDLSAIALALSADNCTPQGQITMSQNPAEGAQVTHDQDVEVVIYDLCNNTDTILVPVILPDVLQIHIVQDDARFCFGDSIALTPSVGGGSAPYEFAWTPLRVRLDTQRRWPQRLQYTERGGTSLRGYARLYGDGYRLQRQHGLRQRHHHRGLHPGSADTDGYG